MGPANMIKLLTQQRRSPWRSKSTPLGPQGLHPTGALARTHQNHEYKTQSRWELLQAKYQQSLRESARTLSEARGLLLDTIKRGTLSKNQKDCLDLANIKAEGQPRGLGRFSDSPKARAAKASDEKPTLRLAEAPSPEALPRKASDGLPILRFARGPAHKASDEVPILLLARGRLGSYPVTAASTGTSRPTNATNHSRDVS